MTNLLGRRARGTYTNDGPQKVEGEIVAVSFNDSGATMYLWLLDDECCVHRCYEYVVLPREHVGALR